MHVTRTHQARAYEAPGHDGVALHRLQGMDVTPLQDLWAARLDLAPGAHIAAKASPAGKLYIVAQGPVRLRGGDAVVELDTGDTAFVLPHEEREIWAHDDTSACLYLVMLERYADAPAEKT